MYIEIQGLPLSIPVTDVFAAFVPLISACILTYGESGKRGVLLLLSRIFNFRRIDTKWWIIILLLPLLIFSIIYFILKLGAYQIPEHWSVSYVSIPLLLLFFFMGALGEEVGYMGYAIKQLLKKNNALWAAIIIGIPWIVWHYPSMLKQGRNFNFFFSGTLGTIAIRVILVWLYINTKRSLFACILMHCLYNTGRVLFLKDTKIDPLIDYPEIHYLSIVAISIAVIFIWNRRTLNNFIFKKLNHAKA